MNSIKDILDKYNVTYKTHGKNIGKGWIGVAPCPSCMDSRFHFGINTKKPQAKCFICGFYGLQKALSTLCNISYNKAKKLINECYDIIEEEEEEPEEKDESEFVKLFNSFGPLQDIHRKYLESRNFDPELLERKYGFRGSDNIGDWKYRLVIPLFYNNSICSFLTRDITGKQEIRYKFCPDEISMIPKRKLWYNCLNIGESILLVEGVFDALRFGRNTISLLSTQFTKEQIARIVKSKFKRIFICFDNDESGEKKGKELANILSAYSKVEIITLDDVADPAKLSNEDAQYILKELGL